MIRYPVTVGMRFWADRPDLVIPVRWYFTDAETPRVPFPGPFLSRVFHKEDEVDWALGPMFSAVCGEDYWSQRIRNTGGRPPWLANVPPPRAGRFCGSDRAWRGEGLFLLDPPLRPSPDGTSLCCGYENAPIVGTVGGGGGPSGRQGNGVIFVGSVGGGGSPNSLQACGADTSGGGPDCESATAASLSHPYQSVPPGADLWYDLGVLPAGRYLWRQLCVHGVDVELWAGACGDLTNVGTLCPGPTDPTLSLYFDVDGIVNAYVSVLVGLSDPGSYVVWDVIPGGCPATPFVVVGTPGGGGAPQSPQAGGGGPHLTATPGGGGGPESPQSGGGGFFIDTTGGGGGGPESPQTGA